MLLSGRSASSNLSTRWCKLGIFLNKGISSNCKINALCSHQEYLRAIACIDPPTGLDVLLQILKLNDEEIIPPNHRFDLNPFLIPLSKSKHDNNLLCYIRWPTQKPNMELQLVRTTQTGISLCALNTTQFCQRLTIEMDFKSHKNSNKTIELMMNNSSNYSYNKNDYLEFFKKSKFPSNSFLQQKLLLDRYILLKVGAFPDLYTNIAFDYLERKDSTSALVTCERSLSLFPGWGYPTGIHAKILSILEGPNEHSKDIARTALTNPLWTAADTFT
eukprot:gene2746-5411_t